MVNFLFSLHSMESDLFIVIVISIAAIALKVFISRIDDNTVFGHWWQYHTTVIHCCSSAVTQMLLCVCNGRNQCGGLDVERNTFSLFVITQKFHRCYRMGRYERAYVDQVENLMVEMHKCRV